MRGDSLLVVNQNMAANKVDTFFRRHVRYDVDARPCPASPASLSGPDRGDHGERGSFLGAVAHVIGPYDSASRRARTVPTSRSTHPSEAGGPRVDGRPVDPREPARSRTGSRVGRPEHPRQVEQHPHPRRRRPGGPLRRRLVPPRRVPPDLARTRRRGDLRRRSPRAGASPRCRGSHPTATAGEGPAGAGRPDTILVRVERTGWAGVWERLTGRFLTATVGPGAPGPGGRGAGSATEAAASFRLAFGERGAVSPHGQLPLSRTGADDSSSSRSDGRSGGLVDSWPCPAGAQTDAPPPVGDP